ncbi:MAG: hypothetical protein WA185_13855 [Candidatus Acidiferrales bacterium]
MKLDVWKISILVVLAFCLGYFYPHKTVHPQGMLKITESYGSGPVVGVIGGVKGFSCIPAPSDSTSSAKCYVLSQ